MSITLDTTGTGTQYLDDTGNYSTPAGAGSGYVTLQTSNITKNVPADYATFDLAQKALNQIMPAPGIVREITVTGHQTAVSSISTFDNFFSPILVRGTTSPVTPTFSSFGTITGSAGAWSVPINVASATGIAAGDVLMMNNFTNSFPSNGTGSVPVQGSLNYGIYRNGTNGITLSYTAGSTSMTLSQSAGTEVVAGDVIVAQGQVRKVSSISGGTSVTLSSAMKQTQGAMVYWYHLKPETGTMSCSGTTITGSSTTFTSRVSPGDYIIVADTDQVMRVSAIGSNTSLTVENGYTISSGSTFCLVKAVWQHEGAFLVTNVTGNVVTVTNTSHSTYAPPAVGLSTPTITVLKDSLAASSGATDGLSIQGAIDINQLALIGSGSTGNGLDAGNKRRADITIGSQTAIIGFANGAYISYGSYLNGNESWFGAASNANVYVTDSGGASLAGAYLHGGGLYNILQDGSHIYASNIRMIGAGSNNHRTDPGASFYCDWGIANGAVSKNLEYISPNFHFVGSQCLSSGSVGMGLSRGATGAGSGSTFFGNGGGGVTSDTSIAECDFSWAAANTGAGFQNSTGMLSFDSSGSTFNSQQGVSTDKGSLTNVDYSYITGNPSEGILTNSKGMLTAVGVYCVENSANDIYAAGGGKVYVSAYKGSPNFANPKNRILTAESCIMDDNLVSF